MRARSLAFCLACALLVPALAGAQRMDPDRARRLAEAERAIAAERWDDAAAILDDLASALEVDEAVLAARLDLALRRAGLSGVRPLDGGLPPDVEAATAVLERRRGLGRRSCLLLADVAVLEGDPDRAAGWLERALEFRPDDDATRFRLALLEMERGRTAAAAGAATDMLRRNPRCPALLQLAGQALLAEGRAVEAIAPLARLVELAPSSAEARSLYGGALLVERRMAEAVEQFRAAIDIDATPERRVNLGLALTLAGAVDEAIDVLERLAAERPDHVGAWNNLGIALATAGRLDEARAALRRALELDPDDPRTQANLRDLEALER
jgi:Flp pilus assembly protein TadD